MGLPIQRGHAEPSQFESSSKALDVSHARQIDKHAKFRAASEETNSSPR